MITKLERKLVNLLLLCDYLFLERKADPNPRKEERVQRRRLRKLVKRAYKMPFYRERFDRVGLTPADITEASDLLRLPMLTKRELQEWMETECEKPDYEGWYIDTTSGSSGTPTKVLYSPREKAWNMANWMRVMAKAGYNPFRGLTVSRISAHSTSGTQQNLLQRMGILRRSFVDQYASEPDVIAQINELQPDFLYMNKTELMRVAIYSDAHDVPVWHPSFFAPTGEMIDRAAERLFAKVFGPGMISSFGTAETGACMVKLPGSDFFRIHHDLFVVDVVDDEGKHVQTGQLVVTPLFKRDVPLINYVVGDRATMGEWNGSSCITSVEGRMNDFITHADGRVTTFFMIAPVFAHFEGVVQTRLVQKSYDLLLVQAVAEPGLDKAAAEEGLRKGLAEHLVAPMQIDFEWLDAIQPDANGKLRLIVNEMA